MFARGGIESATAQAAEGEHDLDRPEDFWDIVLGSGYRGTVDTLRPETSDAVRGEVLGILSPRAVRTLRTDVVFGTAKKAPTQ